MQDQLEEQAKDLKSNSDRNYQNNNENRNKKAGTGRKSALKTEYSIYLLKIDIPTICHQTERETIGDMICLEDA